MSQPHPVTAEMQPRVHVSVLAVDPAGRVLLVQEQKPASRGKWNLPGGHMERGEEVVAAARRELREEKLLDLPLTGLIGVYSSPSAIRFVFLAALPADSTPKPGHEIDAVDLRTPGQVRSLPDASLVNPAMFGRILDDLVAGRCYPLDAFVGCGV